MFKSAQLGQLYLATPGTRYSLPPVMSNTTKSASSKGVRYTDAQKKEVMDFATNYNAANGRGGQSKAAEKFNISPLTIAAWLKGAGAKPVKGAKKAAKKAAAKTSAKSAKPAPKSTKGTRYTDAQKKEVIDFAVAYNAANGRGGQSKAASKFGISPLTIMAWLKAAGVKKGKKGMASKLAKPAPGARKAAGNFDATITRLMALRKEIIKAETELTKLHSKFDSLKASL